MGVRDYYEAKSTFVQFCDNKNYVIFIDSIFRSSHNGNFGSCRIREFGTLDFVLLEHVLCAKHCIRNLSKTESYLIFSILIDVVIPILQIRC